MGLVQAVYGQFRKPHGALGSVAGWIMGHRESNVRRNEWVVHLLAIQATDHVLEVGFGPGLSIAHAARLATHGHVVGIDHSELMVRTAAERNRDAIARGLVSLRLGGFEQLSQLGQTFDKLLLVNVLQFLPERRDALRALHSLMKPGAVLATAYQPRHRGATPEDARAFAQTLSTEMKDLGFVDLSIAELALKPMLVTCVLARRAVESCQ